MHSFHRFPDAAYGTLNLTDSLSNPTTYISEVISETL
jgi:hypothetical protein